MSHVSLWDDAGDLTIRMATFELVSVLFVSYCELIKYGLLYSGVD